MWKLYRQDLQRIQPAAWTFLAGSALMGGAQAVPWTLLQLYLDRLGYSKAAIGGVQAAEAWGQVLVALPAAFLLMRRRTPPLLALASVATAIGYAALPWLPSVGWMWAAKIFIGCAWWLHYVAIAPLLYRHSTTSERPALFGLSDAVHTGAMVFGCWGSGRVVDFLAQRWMSETDALATVLSWSGVLPLVAALVFLRIRESAPAVAPTLDIRATLAKHRGLFARFVVPFWIAGVGAGLCIPFLGLYFQDRFGASPDTVGELYAAWQALATLGFLLSPILVRRASFVWSIVLVQLLSIPFFLVLAFTQNYSIAVGAFLMRGALMNASGPIVKNLMMDVSPEGTREVQVALNSTAWGVAWVVGPWLGGHLLDWTGDSYAALMLSTVVLYVASSVATIWLLLPLDPRKRDPVLR